MPEISKIKIGEDEYILKDPTGLENLPQASATQYGAVMIDEQTVFINTTGKISIKYPYAGVERIGGIRIGYRDNNLYIYNED